MTLVQLKLTFQHRDVKPPIQSTEPVAPVISSSTTGPQIIAKEFEQTRESQDACPDNMVTPQECTVPEDCQSDQMEPSAVQENNREYTRESSQRDEQNTQQANESNPPLASEGETVLAGVETPDEVSQIVNTQEMSQDTTTPSGPNKEAKESTKHTSHHQRVSEKKTKNQQHTRESQSSTSHKGASQAVTQAASCLQHIQRARLFADTRIKSFYPELERDAFLVYFIGMVIKRTGKPNHDTSLSLETLWDAATLMYKIQPRNLYGCLAHSIITGQNAEEASAPIAQEAASEHPISSSHPLPEN